MNNESLLHRVLASLRHLLSLLLTFILPILVYLLSRGKNDYFTNHAKEGMNLHFTFFPVFLILSFVSKKIAMVSILYFLLIILETILAS